MPPQDFLAFLCIGRSSEAVPKVEGMDLDGAVSIATDGFRLFDTSSDGAIVLKEMGKALGQVDIETLQVRMGEADVDDNGYVTFPEFRASPCPRNLRLTSDQLPS